MTLAAEFLDGSRRQNIFVVLVLTFFTLTTVALIVWAISEWRRGKGPYLTVLLISSIIASINDGAGNAMTMLNILPGVKTIVLARQFGEETLLVVASAYPTYIASSGYIAFRAFSDKWSRRKFATAFTSLIAAEATIEYLAIHFGSMFDYEGGQSLEVFKLPIVWPMVYVTATVIIGGLLFLLAQYLPGPRIFLTIPILSAGFLGFTLLAAWPTIIALHTDTGGFPKWMVTIIGIGCMLITLYAFTSLLDRTDTTTESIRIDADRAVV